MQYGQKPSTVELITSAARTNHLRKVLPVLSEQERERLLSWRIPPYGAVISHKEYYYAPILCATEEDGIKILEGVRPYVEEDRVAYYVCPILVDLHLYRVTKEDGIEKYRVFQCAGV